MEFENKNNCRLNGVAFPNGAEIAARGKILDCVNGKWEEVTLVSGI